MFKNLSLTRKEISQYYLDSISVLRSIRRKVPRRTDQIKMTTTTRIRMNIEGSGELEDGTVYDRKLTIRETTEMQGFRTVFREVTEERVEIAR